MSESQRRSERLLFTADVGGTNTTVGLIRIKDGTFSIVDKLSFSTRKISGIEEAMGDARHKLPGEDAEGFCISCAGPVRNNSCVLSNAAWDIDGANVERETGMKTLLVNDFVAVSYCLPLLDTSDPSQVAVLPHPGGRLPAPTPDPHGLVVRAVLGAGTGLGVGYLVEDRGRFFGLPSEGGHADFAPFDAETEQFRAFLRDRIGENPGTELFVSGQGIGNLWDFYRETGRISQAEIEARPALGRIEAASAEHRPSLISQASDDEELCAAIMRGFVRMYAKYAGNLALVFIPTGGFFLAGGIAAKNVRWFVEDDLFMRHFIMNYKDSVRPLLDTVPVYIVKEYSMSLLGAANAFVSRQNGGARAETTASGAGKSGR